MSNGLNNSYVSMPFIHTAKLRLTYAHNSSFKLLNFLFITCVHNRQTLHWLEVCE